MIINTCECANTRNIYRDNAINIAKCAACGTYWLTSAIDPEPRPADGDALALAAAVENLLTKAVRGAEIVAAHRTASRP
ncbi:MAG: hypothetical protein KDJ43_00555 [Rhizobiaceae bacterium]|nr:hypothetical protein [Rhizobiaceae bacterium]